MDQCSLQCSINVPGLAGRGSVPVELPVADSLGQPAGVPPGTLGVELVLGVIVEGLGSSVWNNDGDTATLKRPDGGVISTLTRS